MSFHSILPYKRNFFFHPCSNIQTFPLAIKNCYPVVPSLIHFCLVFFCRYSWTCSWPEYGWNIAHWTLSNNLINQSINKGNNQIYFISGEVSILKKSLLHQPHLQFTPWHLNLQKIMRILPVGGVIINQK